MSMTFSIIGLLPMPSVDAVVRGRAPVLKSGHHMPVSQKTTDVTDITDGRRRHPDVRRAAIARTSFVLTPPLFATILQGLCGVCAGFEVFRNRPLRRPS